MWFSDAKQFWLDATSDKLTSFDALIVTENYIVETVANLCTGSSRQVFPDSAKLAVFSECCCIQRQSAQSPGQTEAGRRR